MFNKALIQGGAILCQYNCTVNIHDCNFTGNRADNGGGIIISDDSAIKITHSIFHNNSAVSMFGGAISVKNSFLHLSDVTFYQNTAAIYGGAIHAHKNSNLVVEKCSFSSNNGQRGGAVVLQFNVTITLVNTTFRQNKAVEGGGAIFGSSFRYFEIYGCLFTSNVNGVLWATENSHISIANSEFNNNKFELGGALYLCTWNELYVSNVTFVENMASNGGAIYAIDHNKIVISNCVFKNNFAQHDAGAFVLFGEGFSEVHIVDSIFQNNTANLGSGDGVHVVLASLALVNCSVKNNQAVVAAAVYLDRSKSSITYSVFKENIAAKKEGGLISTATGGAINAENSDINITHSNFFENQCAIGGAMYLGGSNLTMDKTTFLKNVATDYAGAMALYTNTNVQMHGCMVINNYAPRAGGISNYGSNFVATNSTFEGNIAKIFFGGCLSLGGRTVASFEACTLKGNLAPGGGAMYIQNSILKISKTSFSNNTASEGLDVYYDSQGASELKTDTYASSFHHTNFTIRTSDEDFATQALDEHVIHAKNVDLLFHESPYASGMVKIN